MATGSSLPDADFNPGVSQASMEHLAHDRYHVPYGRLTVEQRAALGAEAAWQLGEDERVEQELADVPHVVVHTEHKAQAHRAGKAPHASVKEQQGLLGKDAPQIK